MIRVLASILALLMAACSSLPDPFKQDVGEVTVTVENANPPSGQAGAPGPREISLFRQVSYKADPPVWIATSRIPVEVTFFVDGWTSVENASLDILGGRVVTGSLTGRSTGATLKLKPYRRGDFYGQRVVLTAPQPIRGPHSATVNFKIEPHPCSQRAGRMPIIVGTDLTLNVATGQVVEREGQLRILWQPVERRETDECAQ